MEGEPEGRMGMCEVDRGVARDKGRAAWRKRDRCCRQATVKGVDKVGLQHLLKSG